MNDPDKSAQQRALEADLELTRSVAANDDVAYDPMQEEAYFQLGLETLAQMAEYGDEGTQDVAHEQLASASRADIVALGRTTSDVRAGYEAVLDRTFETLCSKVVMSLVEKGVVSIVEMARLDEERAARVLAVMHDGLAIHAARVDMSPEGLCEVTVAGPTEDVAALLDGAREDGLEIVYREGRSDD